MDDLLKRNGWRDPAALSLATSALEACYGLLESKLQATRECVELEDQQSVIETESLSAQARAWRAGVADVIAEISALSASGNLLTELQSAYEKAAAVASDARSTLEAVLNDGGDVKAREIVAGFQSDRIFMRFLEKTNEAGRLPRIAGTFAKMVSFDRERAAYASAIAYLSERAAWIDRAQRRADQLAGEAGSLSQRLLDERDFLVSVEEKAERGWKAVIASLSPGGAAMEEIDMEISCGLAREAAALGVRSGSASLPGLQEIQVKATAAENLRNDIARLGQSARDDV